MTFKNVIFGFNFCQKRQVKFHLRSKPDLNIDLIHFHYHRKNVRKLPFLTRNINFQKFHGYFGIRFSVNENFFRKMPSSGLRKNLNLGKFQKCWHRFSTLCLIELQRRILLVILLLELIFLRMDSSHQYHWFLHFF